MCVVFLIAGGKIKKSKFGNSLKLPPINTAFDALFGPLLTGFSKSKYLADFVNLLFGANPAGVGAPYLFSYESNPQSARKRCPC